MSAIPLKPCLSATYDQTVILSAAVFLAAKEVDAQNVLLCARTRADQVVFQRQKEECSASGVAAATCTYTQTLHRPTSKLVLSSDHDVTVPYM